MVKRIYSNNLNAQPLEPGLPPGSFFLPCPLGNFTSISSRFDFKLPLVRYAAVIPCFNEAKTITPLVLALQQHLDFVAVVDDGSIDETALKAGAAGADVICHERNSGKGAALRTGLSRVLNLGFEWAVTLDGDAQHDPADLPALVQCAEQTGALLVIGNRMHRADAMPWLRRHVNRWMS